MIYLAQNFHAHILPSWLPRCVLLLIKLTTPLLNGGIIQIKHILKSYSTGTHIAMDFSREALKTEYKDITDDLERLMKGSPTQRAQVQNFREKLFDLRYSYQICYRVELLTQF